MYALSEIQALRRQCNDYQLQGREILAAFSDQELRRICNGIGAEWMPDAARVWVSNLNPALEPVAMIHDVRWYLSTGKRADFEASNREFEANGLIMARARYGWYNPLRYRVMRRTKEFALILSRCFEGYHSCYRERLGVR